MAVVLSYLSGCQRGAATERSHAPFPELVFRNRVRPELIAFFERFRGVSKKVVAIEIIEDGDERVLLRTYDDGSEDRVTIVRKARKKGRISNKIAWYRDLRTGRKIFY